MDERTPQELKPPWEQIEGEPAAAYTRFLSYRNLGPCRTVRLAAATHGEAPKGTKRHQASGQWKADCQRWKWVERAEAWDVWRMLDVADAVHAAMTELARQLACRGLHCVLDDHKASGWRAGLEIFNTLAAVVQKRPAESDGPRLMRDAVHGGD